MDVRRRLINSSTSSGEHLKTQKLKHGDSNQVPPLPLYLANVVFFILFFSVAYFLLHRWREKIRTSTPLHVLTASESAAIVSLVISVVYLLGFFGVGSRSEELSDDDESIAKDDARKPGPCLAALVDPSPAPVKIVDSSPIVLSQEDEEIVKSVVSGAIPSYSLETRLGECGRAAAIRREAVERISGRSLEGLPVEGFDYQSILGQCCEMPIGCVQLPVGVAGPLLLDGKEYIVPMATTEGCLVASTNRGCKAIHLSGGASSILLKDGMTRAPVVRFATAKRAAQLKFYLEDPLNFDTLAIIFNK